MPIFFEYSDKICVAAAVTFSCIAKTTSSCAVVDKGEIIGKSAVVTVPISEMNGE